jgi:hypothetical protein
MEKNGAISNNTPRCGNSCGCSQMKQAEDALGQREIFPNSQTAADQIDNDLTKLAADAVKKASL